MQGRIWRGTNRQTWVSQQECSTCLAPAQVSLCQRQKHTNKTVQDKKEICDLHVLQLSLRIFQGNAQQHTEASSYWTYLFTTHWEREESKLRLNTLFHFISQVTTDFTGQLYSHQRKHHYKTFFSVLSLLEIS